MVMIKNSFVFVLGIIMQLFISLSVCVFFRDYMFEIFILCKFLGFMIVISIYYKSRSLSYDIPWIILIMLFPVVGTVLYIVLGTNICINKKLRKLNKNIKNMGKYLMIDNYVSKEINDRGLDKLKYISSMGYSVTKFNKVMYYSLGELEFQDMLKELKSAKKFIFIEFLTISIGKMWNDILEILEEKIKEGVEVRIIYDAIGCTSKIPSNYHKQLEDRGIKCVVFNKSNIFIGSGMRNRDHRKIMIIDGFCAFSGGINLSDEYINLKKKYGHWKDVGTCVFGESVWNYTVMFLTVWNSYRNEDNDFNIYKYYFGNKYNSNGYISAYGNNPLDNELLGRNIYLNIINQAKKYVYIYTPYFVVDREVENALVLCAKRGVDVRIVVPDIPDKKSVYMVSCSYFEFLIKKGVKIYKYVPGFMHGKVILCDDMIATVGSINFDYRSFYLDFECGLYMENVDVIKDIKKDMDITINKSHKVVLKECMGNIFTKISFCILRFFSIFM